MTSEGRGMTQLSVALVKASALIQRLDDHREQGAYWSITSGLPENPWIHVAWVDVDMETQDIRSSRFAIQRETADIYVVDEHGAVGNEPIDLGDVAS